MIRVTLLAGANACLRWRVYRIDPNGLAAMRAWLDQFWDVALQAYAAEFEPAGARAPEET